MGDRTRGAETWIDALAMPFDRAWMAGQRPRIEDYLAQVEAARRPPLLAELLRVELEYRRAAGEATDREEYERRFAGEAGAVRAAFAEQETVAPLVDPTADLAPGDRPAPGPAGGDRPPPPVRIGKYEVLGRLGGGGQGAAFLARDPDCGRLVVLKRYHTAARDPGAEGALQDGKALARLRSPFVPRCYGLERHDDELILVMEYIPGRTLSELMRSRPPSPAAAARLVERVAEGLEAVHACGLLHRDIKPANIVVGDDGVPRLVDFGLAAHLGSAALEGLSGTPGYMAPEQARRQWERIDPRTDVYGLGGVLYALLTGGPPHPGATPEEQLAHARRGEVTPPRALKPSIPRGLERIVLKALAADPDRRYASAAALRQALRMFSIRRRVMAPAAAAIGLALVAGIILTARDRRPPAEAPRIVDFAVEHYRGDRPDRLGTLGVTTRDARVDDDLRVRARLTAPAYCYLLALTADGQIELRHPPETTRAPRPATEISYPADPAVYYGLTDGPGLQAFVLVVSREPLPPFADWRPGGALPWVPLDGEADGVWSYDGRWFEPLPREEGVRGEERRRSRPPEPFAKVCESLKGRPEMDAIRALAFPVKAAD